MLAPWRALGLCLLLLLAAACSNATATPAATARPTFTRAPVTQLAAASATRTPAGATPSRTPASASASATPAASDASPLPGATPGGTPAATDDPVGIATATATPTELGQAAGPCTNDVEYIADLSVPDGTQFLPGDPVLKQWSVRNAGTCDWDSGYRLVLVSGNALGARSELALFPARAGLEAVIEVPMIAPAEPGSYTGRWQARDPAGNVFGDRIFITIQVVAPATPTETTTPTP
jgi:hypothetical protein